VKNIIIVNSIGQNTAQKISPVIKAETYRNKSVVVIAVAVSSRITMNIEFKANYCYG